MVERVSMMTPMPPSPFWEVDSALVCAGAGVCLGIWTPIAGGMEAVAEVLMTLSRPAQSQTHLLLAIVAVCLTLLGPGAWSIDALMFGRKRIAV